MLVLKFKTMVFWLILLGLTARGVSSIFETTLKPFYTSTNTILTLLVQNDENLFQERAKDLWQLSHLINTYPSSTRFYFVPCFSDAENKVYWWWYVYLITRYFSYPREIYCHDQMLYAYSKDIYLKRWIKDAKTYIDIPWIKNRHIQYIILMRHNLINILPSDTAIRDL